MLGAAAGAGMALFLAMTIVVYRYYHHRRKAKEWGSLDRMPFPPSQHLQKRPSKPTYAITQKVSKRALFLDSNSKPVYIGRDASYLTRQ